MDKHFPAVQTCIVSDIHSGVEQFDHMVVLVSVLLSLYIDFRLYSRDQYARTPFSPASFDDDIQSPLNQMTVLSSTYDLAPALNSAINTL